MTMIDQKTDCPICYQTYHKPQKLMPCGHTFCDPCLRRMANMPFITTNKYHNCCAYCRTPIKECVDNLSLAAKIKEEVSEAEFDEREYVETSSGVYQLALPPLKIKEVGQEKQFDFFSIFCVVVIVIAHLYYSMCTYDIIKVLTRHPHNNVGEIILMLLLSLGCLCPILILIILLVTYILKIQ